MHMCVCVARTRVRARVYVCRSDDSLWELFLSFHHVILGPIRWSCLETGFNLWSHLTVTFSLLMFCFETWSFRLVAFA